MEQSCFVISAKAKKSEQWMALGLKTSRAEAEALAKDTLRKVPFLDSYKIEETTYAEAIDQTQPDRSAISEITPKELKRRLAAGDASLQLLDVREDWETDTFIIPGALRVKVKDLPQQLVNLPKEKEYVVYCAAGYRAFSACEFLQENGYLVHNLKGGMLGWKGIGFVVPIFDTAMSISGFLRKRN